ncbi:MAG TPA: S41 family peptidase [Gammaproteobacteria bacterium]
MFNLIFLVATVTTYGCPQVLNDTIAATEANYAGTRAKLPDGPATNYYRNFKALLAEDAPGLDPLACKRLLDRYIGFFADHHLFVANNHHRMPVLPAMIKDWDRPSVTKYLSDNATHLDPLEGFWYDVNGALAVVREPGNANRLLGFRPATETEAAKLLATFERGHGGIEVMYEHAEWGWQNAEAGLHRDDTLLIFGLTGWGRASDSLSTVDPLAPVFRDLGDGIYYLSMPSFLEPYRAPLNAIIATHGSELAQAKGVVFDVRGNAGGNAIYFPLADYFLAEDIQIGSATDILVSESTTGFLERFRERMGQHGGWLDEPLARIHAADNGELIPFREASYDGNESYSAKPEKVVVLQDRGTGSAAEAFLFHAGQSSKVVTAGQPSRGNIDYMQVTMLKLGEGDFSYWFGYPLYAKRSLPEESIDDEGYAPDIRLAQDQDWVSWSKRWLLQATGDE